MSVIVIGAAGPKGKSPVAQDPLTAGTITANAGDTQVSLSATAPSGGTSPYTYQWHRSTTSGSTPGAGTAISGFTSLSETDTGLANGTAYYYKLVATDSASASVTYTEKSATPAANTVPTVPAVLSSNIHLDHRSGGADDIQVATDLADAKSKGDIVYSTKFTFATDFDGAGTHAFRAEFPGGGITDVRAELQYYWGSSEKPREFYIQLKQRMGRHPNDPGGIGAVDYFDCSSAQEALAGRKLFRWLRQFVGGGSRWSFDILWHGRGPGLDVAGVDPHFSYFNEVDGEGNPAEQVAQSWQPEDYVGEVLTHTYYFKASSGYQTKDGVVKWWIEGDTSGLIDSGERLAVAMGVMTFDRMEWPVIVRSPVSDQTEYWWDTVVWSDYAPSTKPSGAAVSDLSATAGAGQVDLSFTPVESSLPHFVERTPGWNAKDGEASDADVIGVVAAGSGSFTDTNHLTAGRTYSYRVIPYNDGYAGPASNSDTATPS